MACTCCSNNEGAVASKRIDRTIKKEKKDLELEVKLLLLGTGDSGKSTIAKQMKIIHLSGYSLKERMAFKPIIHHNIKSSMRTLLEQNSRFNWILPPETQEVATRFLTMVDSMDIGAGISPSMLQDLKYLWEDSVIQQTFDKANEFYIMENVIHYYKTIDQIAAEDYVPSDRDILLSRTTTTGIYETEFEMGNAHFRLIDVGGQRTERKKWIHCFEGVTAVVYCVALSEYDQRLLEDETTNRMSESLQLFGEICNSRWFADTAIILFLNKKDLFEEKLKKTSLSVCFPDYQGKNEFQEAGSYIQNQFFAQMKNSEKVIYPHFTCATDTTNITVVFDAVRDIVLRYQMELLGL